LAGRLKTPRKVYVSEKTSGPNEGRDKTRVRQMFPMLSVADLARSLHFYGELLGGERSYQFPEEGDPAFVVCVSASPSWVSVAWATSRLCTDKRYVRYRATA
jgi:Glyoxalase/Bleomycin resistance protein/Dioxygenase superfamily